MKRAEARERYELESVIERLSHAVEGDERPSQRPSEEKETLTAEEEVGWSRPVISKIRQGIVGEVIYCHERQTDNQRQEQYWIGAMARPTSSCVQVSDDSEVWIG